MTQEKEEIIDLLTIALAKLADEAVVRDKVINELIDVVNDLKRKVAELHGTNHRYGWGPL